MLVGRSGGGCKGQWIELEAVVTCRKDDGELMVPAREGWFMIMAMNEDVKGM